MKVLVTGGNGQLGRSLTAATWPPEFEVIALGREACDLGDDESLMTALAIHDPDLVINAGAYTDVEGAEDHHGPAFAINAKGAGVLAGLCALAGIGLIHLSTDAVFDGDKGEPYTPLDPVNPLAVYAASKVAGEQNVLAMHPQAVIVRTAWLMAPTGRNFLTTMLRLGKTRTTLDVVADQRGCPTFTRDLAKGLLALAVAMAEGRLGGGTILHMTNAGDASWFDLASAIFDESAKRGGPAPQVRPIPSHSYPSKVRRPRDSRLDSAGIAALGIALPHWRDSLPDIIAAALAAE